MPGLPGVGPWAPGKSKSAGHVGELGHDPLQELQSWGVKFVKGWPVRSQVVTIISSVRGCLAGVNRDSRDRLSCL